jgi:radical SAM protein with 4Fe4S-binding SPASM domain
VFPGAVPPPRFVSIETTRYCNLRCRMCVQFQDGTTVTGPHMPIEQFEHIARSVFPHVERWQPSVAGEPTMSRGFERMIALAAHFGVKAEVFTNGTLLDQAMVEKLAPNLAALTVSFDGATAATFEHIREGAKFSEVKANLQRLVRHCRATLPPQLQPLFALNCTLMERNVRELPALVRLAATELGVDQVSVYHVYPVTQEMRSQSLVHHQELARACIAEACQVAAEVGIGLRVEALDRLTAAMALGSGPHRTYATTDGVVAGLEARVVRPPRPRPPPLLRPEHPDYDEISVRRRQAAAGFELPPPPAADGAAADEAAGQTAAVGYCDFLWNKIYVAIDGDVRPCCVHGMPVLGNLLREPFDAVWNNELYRTMRQRMVAQDPVPACRGCMHIREVRDPAAVRRLLGGLRKPRPDELPPLPAALDPANDRPHRSGPPPLLEWPAAEGARSYELQFSLDRFASLLFTTAGPLGGPSVRSNHYQVPLRAWRDVPVEREIFYRVLAKLPDGDRVVAAGSAPAET